MRNSPSRHPGFFRNLLAVRRVRLAGVACAKDASMWLRIGLALAGLALVVSLFATGAIEVLTDVERAAALLRSLGIWGYVLYMGSFALLEPFGVAGVLFVVPAALVWPTWLAASLSIVGATGAGIVGASFARFIARDWVEARMPDRFRAFDQRLAERGLRTVIVVRLIFFLAAPAHWALGLSSVPFRTLILGSVIGFIPGIVALTLLSDSLVQATPNAPSWVWIVLAGTIGGALVLHRLHARRASRASTAAQLAAEPDPRT